MRPSNHSQQPSFCSWQCCGAGEAGAGADRAGSQLVRGRERRYPDQRISGCAAVIRGGREKGDKVAEVLNNRGMAYRSKDDIDRAIQDYNRAIQINPKFASAFNNRGVAYDLKGDYDQAIQDYEQAIKLDAGLRPSLFQPRQRVSRHVRARTTVRARQTLRAESLRPRRQAHAGGEGQFRLSAPWACSAIPCFGRSTSSSSGERQPVDFTTRDLNQVRCANPRMRRLHRW